MLKLLICLTLLTLVKCQRFSQRPTPAPAEEALIAENVRLRQELLKNTVYQDAINDFTKELLIQAWNDEGDNFVLSPFSLHTALSILASASSNTSLTQSELLLALGRSQDLENLELIYKKLIQEFLTSKDITDVLSFGTRCWTPKNYFQKISNQFLQKVTDLYDVSINVLQDQRPEIEINDWVRKQTKGKIDKIIDSVSSDAALLIVNALYFNAAWTVAFEDLPDPQEFTTLKGQKVLTNMVTRSSYQNIVAEFTLFSPLNMEFTALAIPYLGDQEDRFEFVILMPKDYRGLDWTLDQLVNGQAPEGNFLDTVFQKLDEKRSNGKQLNVTMPSFSIDSKINAVKHLRNMGINAAFDKGEFDGIIQNESFKVGDIKHRAKVEVTKDGTVGAAATAIEFVTLSGDFDLPQDVLINKPFLFFIRDIRMKSIIFAGKFSRP